MAMRRTFAFSLCLLVSFFLAGCAQEPGTGGDLAGPPGGPPVSGFTYCYGCHSADPGTTTDPAKLVFAEWLVSRHGNFQSAMGTEVDPYTLKDAVGHSYLYSQIVGDPSPSPYYSFNGPELGSCYPCHVGPNLGGVVLAENKGGELFSHPNLGRYRRGVVDC
jgi:hypothetical protein